MDFEKYNYGANSRNSLKVTKLNLQIKTACKSIQDADFDVSLRETQPGGWG